MRSFNGHFRVPCHELILSTLCFLLMALITKITACVCFTVQHPAVPPGPGTGGPVGKAEQGCHFLDFVWATVTKVTQKKAALLTSASALCFWEGQCRVHSSYIVLQHIIQLVTQLCNLVRITVCGCSVAVAAAAAASAIRDGAALLVPGWVSGLVHAGTVSPEGSSVSRSSRRGKTSALTRFD